jgi:hypothetical protein
MLNLQKSSCIFCKWLQNVRVQSPEIHSGGKVVVLEGNRRPGQKETLPGGAVELAHEKARQ